MMVGDGLSYFSKAFCINGKAQAPGEPVYEHRNIIDAAGTPVAPYHA
jgi:hypothetical protein